MLKLRALESALSSCVPEFASPEHALEQYRTPAALAARVLWSAAAAGHLRGARVLDLGCGTGVFTVGAALCGAASVTGVDASRAALAQASDAVAALADLGGGGGGGSDAAARVDLVLAAVSAGATPAPALPLRRGAWDTALLNPPFGCVVPSQWKICS